MAAKTTLFRALHHRDRPLVLPNAWDYASAALLAAEGFPAVGTTSLGVAAAAGLPDGTGVTRAKTLLLATRLTQLTVPVTVDIEGGFSDDPAAVAEFAWQLAELGIAGVNLEDGRSDAALADPGHQAELIRAIKGRAPELFVNARVDTHWLGLDHDSTLTRVARYEKSGADGIFVPGLAEPEQIRTVVGATGLPVNVLYLSTGPSVAELAALGVRRVSTGSLLYRAALAATLDTARGVRDGTAIAGGIPTYQEVQAQTPS
ncbi:isocitrate lyase/PEP mutase family protein [Nocardia goodfellowii]|uniref:2-methylisocitrate lyase-like PEP mutase family enzyme n=1 Tax=Nocardia goodfellowii TaxID=882446 RepID=A0ABS4QP65_9NOCA|nr:isocitrate lyase/phosphoenolpyruvate mutase family protein [Nocardia goodfellowii]MBP2193487.1 2-methylisocitrate lyase-like PEP mutase family enzyme [Nocardia goodfellowii]